MRSLRAWLRRLSTTLGVRHDDGAVADELQAHVEMHADENRREGMTPEAARRDALLHLGGLQQTAEQYRDRQRILFLDTLMRDTRYAVRQLAHNPGFALSAILTLAVCIGANTAMYSVVQAVIFRPLPYPQPGRLVQLATVFETPGAGEGPGSYDGAAWQVVHDGVPALTFAADSDLSTGINLVARNSVTYLHQHRVSADFFRVLGVSPIVGRVFRPSDDQAGSAQVAVLSYELWVSVFDRDPTVVGQQVMLRGEPHTIVGVMPRGFQTDVIADTWTPLRPSLEGEGSGQNYRVIARLQPDATLAQAQAQVAGVSAEALAHAQQAKQRAMHLTLIPLQRGLTDAVRRPVAVLWTAVSFVLLIGCLNVAGLLFARAAMRRREIATRLALGGSRTRVVGQLFVESLVLAGCGAAGGIALGFTATHVLATTIADSLPAFATIGVNLRVLLVMLGVTGLTTIVYGWLPAWHAMRIDVRAALIDSGNRGIVGGSRRWPRRILVAGELALSTVLLIGAGVLLHSFLRLSTQAPGFDPTHVVTATVSMQDARYATTAQINELFEKTLARIRALPGVESASVAMRLPYQRGLNLGFKRLDGPLPLQPFETTTFTYVTPGYFEALRMPIKAGRSFTETDRAGAQNVVVVNETFVRRYLSGQAPIGAHIGISAGSREVVGIVNDTPQAGIAFGAGPVAFVPAVFIPVAQAPNALMQIAHTWWSPQWVVRTQTDDASVRTSMQEALKATDPSMVFADFQSVAQLRDAALLQPQLLSLLLSLFALMALGLAAVGTYGLVANTVFERRRELGIRLALGASVKQALQTAAMPGITLSVVGVLAGIALAWLSRGVLRGLIWEVSPSDGPSFALGAAALLIVAGVATLLPTISVLRLDPARTLREE